MKMYKGFDKDLKCIGFQYEIGKTYEEESAVLCKKGFHACENPIDVFSYYPPANSRFCEVDLEELSEEKIDDSKRSGKRISVNAEIGIKGIVDAFVKFTMEKIDFSKNNSTNTGNQSAATNTGNQSAATNTGNWSTATNTGDWSAATNTGYRSAATNTGDWSAATNTGYRSAATNTGYRSAATNTGNQSAATNTGNWSAATNTGYRSAATNTGDWSAATNTGNQSAATNTGYRSAATNTGYRSAATNTGDQSAATNTGNWSAATNTGNWSAAEVSGKGSVAISTGYCGKVRGALGCAIVSVERDDNMNLVSICSEIVDGEHIKPDVWYMVKNGDFVEVEGE